MNSIEQLQALLERVEVATGADSSLDMDLAELLRQPILSADEISRLKAKGLNIFSGNLFLPSNYNFTSSIDAVLAIFEKMLPGFWWSCGFCELTNDASVYVPGARASIGVDFRAGEASRRLLDGPFGKDFDEGFHGDRIGGNVPLALLGALLKARIKLLEAQTA